MDFKRQMELTRAYRMENLPSFLYRLSVDDLPDASTQAKVIPSLVPDPALPDLHNYKYAVCSHWYTHWQKYMGRANKKLPGQTAPPGPITISTPPGNTYVEGHVWKQLVQWYGCVPGYPYDRCTKDCVTPCLVNFEVGYLNGLLGRIKHHVKALDMSECIGYVEFQLRCVMKVPKEAQTRLWCQRKEEGSKVEPVLDRCETLSDAIHEEKGVTYILALELKDPNGLWPSGVPDSQNDIDLEKYYVLTEGYKLKDFRNEKLPLSFVSESLCNLKDSHLINFLDVVVSDDVVSHKVRACQRLEQEAQKCVDHYNKQLEELKKEVARFNEKQTEFQTTKDAFDAEKCEFGQTRTEFETNLKQMQQENKRTESTVTLNVGGHYYLTSIATLTSDPDTMLAKMFGGTFPVKPLKDGTYFIDRNGSLFPYILDYLRNGDIYELTLPDNIRQYNALCREMDYYQIKGFDYIGEKCDIFQEAFDFSECFFTELLSDGGSAY